jgi:hypothetical protein
MTNGLILERERITEQLNQEHRIELAKMKKKEAEILSQIVVETTDENAPEDKK